MRRRKAKVFIGCQQLHVMPDAKLRDERVNRTHLNASSATCIANLCGLDVILVIWLDERKCCKAFDNV